jgi:type II secretory pathway pseudopilin PulG
MPQKQLKAFTLVELIVVITIVWILSTIGFVSYSGYLTGARDSNRTSQMVKLSDSLQVYSATKTLPLPDNYVEIEASWSLIAYQWEVWVDVLETIDYTNGGTDPKDGSYYTYYLTKDRKSMQLMAMMEEQSLSANLNNNKLNIKNTYAADYEDRFAKVYGRKLWTLTQETTNTPIQQLSTFSSTPFELTTETWVFIAHVSNDTQITWTGEVLLRVMSTLNNNLLEYDTSLAAAYDMESFSSDWKLLDLTGNWNSWTCHVSLSESYSCSKNGDIVFSDGEVRFTWWWNFISIPSDISALTNFTIISKFNVSDPSEQNSIIGNSFTSTPWDGFFYGINNTQQIWGLIYDGSRNLHQILWSTQIKANRYYTWTMSFDGGDIKLFLDWKKEVEKTISWISNRNAVTSIWKQNSAYWPLNGWIKHMRIYNKALSESEIQIISSLIK